jgi:DNA-directed RNA polymerase subunit RPC12/RpoP
MSRERLITAGVVLVLLAVVGTFAWNWRPANNANRPDGVYYLCANQKCGHEWNMTMRELSDHHEEHYGQPVPCPKCGETKTVRAEKCIHCGKLFVSTRDPRPCPHCKKPQI